MIDILPKCGHTAMFGNIKHGYGHIKHMDLFGFGFCEYHNSFRQVKCKYPKKTGRTIRYKRFTLPCAANRH
jgi:hypothetical protein